MSRRAANFFSGMIARPRSQFQNADLLSLSVISDEKMDNRHANAPRIWEPARHFGKRKEE